MFPETATAVLVFLHCTDWDTRWNADAKVIMVGLNRPGVEATARLMGVEMDAEDFGFIRVCENEVININNGRNNGNSD